MAEIDISRAVGACTGALPVSYPMFRVFLLWLSEPHETFVEMFGEGPDPQRVEHAQVTLTINGVNLDVLPAFKRLDACWDAEVRSAAKGLIHEEFTAIEEMLQELRSSISGQIQKKLRIDEVADKVTTHLVDQELRGHWQKEAPTQDGLHWLSDRHGTLLTPVYFAGGKAIVAKDDAPGGPAWDGWYWSEPIKQPPKLARKLQDEGA